MKKQQMCIRTGSKALSSYYSLCRDFCTVGCKPIFSLSNKDPFNLSMYIFSYVAKLLLSQSADFDETWTE